MGVQRRRGRPEGTRSVVPRGAGSAHTRRDLPSGALRVLRYRRTLRALRMRGLTAQIVASQRIPFGPVLTARAQWLQDTGRTTLGQRRERLVVIRADR